MPTVAEIAADLAAEHDSLDAVLAELSPDQWSLATPSPGWDVADQVGHLGYFDRTAALAITDLESFKAQARQMLDKVLDEGADAALPHLARFVNDGAGFDTLEAYSGKFHAQAVHESTLKDVRSRLAELEPETPALAALDRRLEALAPAGA